VQDNGAVFTDAYAEDVANSATLSADVSWSNASVSNTVEDWDYSIKDAIAYTDYSISIDHTYDTASGLSSILGSVLISFNCHAEVTTYGIPPFMGVIPGAAADARVSINGNATMDFTFRN
jgi:hypothetical protein